MDSFSLLTSPDSYREHGFSIQFVFAKLFAETRNEIIYKPVARH